uniref:Dolicholphosphate-mannose synthase n=1 Tax=Trypanosoma congolense (strain IL3000) TaxID=1068625 RepID=G0UW62_TRYCI|nr:conserved hypothetical protein [Trypanosoma congolense IL3000]
MPISVPLLLLAMLWLLPPQLLHNFLSFFLLLVHFIYRAPNFPWTSEAASTRGGRGVTQSRSLALAPMAKEPSHWDFFKLPPFFTLQPAPAALERQLMLWGNLVMDHAASHAPNTRSDACPFLRLYSCTSSLFRNDSINRRLSSEHAKKVLSSLAVQRPEHCVLTGNDDNEEDVSLLVSTNKGGLKELEQSLLEWILERGVGTTVAHLSQKGVVMTFNELVDGHCLAYKCESSGLVRRLSQDVVPIEDVGVLSHEQAVRCFLHTLSVRPISHQGLFSVTLFNLDGSNRRPYEGVKFGGAAAR